jgi:hypothetical protein
MRLRDETLPAGRLLAHFDSDDRSRNRSLLFLVAGAADIEPLTHIEEACRTAIADLDLKGFEWHAVPDQGLLTSIDPNLAPSGVARLEVAEMAIIPSAELDELLRPVLSRIALGDTELFPSAGGAVGAPAEGIHLLGRELEIAKLARLVDDGKSVLLVAPRRSGKTSVLRCLETALSARYRTAYVDLERFLSPEEVASRLWVIASGERIRLAQQRAEVDWKALFSESLRHLDGGACLVRSCSCLTSWSSSYRAWRSPKGRTAIDGSRSSGSFVTCLVSASMPRLASSWQARSRSRTT